MSVGILKRIRHYPERFRHLKYTWVMGSGGGSIPGVDAGVDAGAGTIYFGGKRSPNVEATITVSYNVDTGIDPGPGTPTPGSVNVAIPPLSEPAEQAALVAAALNAEPLLTASATGLTVSVAATDDVNNLLTTMSVTGGVNPPAVIGEKELELTVVYKPDVMMGVITVNEKSPDTATVTGFRVTLTSPSTGSFEKTVNVTVGADVTKANVAKAIAQALNADDMLTADSTRATVEVVGQGGYTLTDITRT